MNDSATHTAHVRLQAVLTKLRQKEHAPGIGRTLRGTGSDGLIAAIVTEIGETILPRKLTLKPDNGPTLCIAAANRRLQALLAPAPASANDLADAALKDADDPNLAKLLDVLKSELAAAKSLSVSSSRLGEVTFPSDVGVPSNILSRVWNLSTTETEPAEPGQSVASFLAGLDNDALGWIQIEGEEVTAESGEEDFIVELSEQAALFLDGYFSKQDSIFGEGAAAIALGPLGTDGTAVLFVDYDGVSAFIAMPANNLGQIATRWQSVVIAGR